MECMMREPLLRPSSIELQRRTAEGLALAKKASSAVLGEPLVDVPRDNVPFTDLTPSEE